MPASKFIVAAFENSLEPGEIVTEINFPPYVTETGSAYENLKHPASDRTICGIAAFVKKSPSGTVDECRVAVTGTTAYAIRLPKVEAALMGKAPTAENIAVAAKYAMESLRTTESDRERIPLLSDHYASVDYRIYMTSVLTNRSLTRATARALVSA
jgi:carbon-monoxide dehydrogenase medium subunit